MNRTVLSAFLMLLAPQSQPRLSMTQQIQPQSAQVGTTATFTAAVSSGPCRTIIYKNGIMLQWGPITGSDGIVSYTTPPVTLADNGSTYAFEFYGCPQSGTIRTPPAALTVTQSGSQVLSQVASPPVTLTLGGSALFDDGTPIMANASATANQLENGAMVQIGSVASDAQGNLSGTVAVAPQFTNANGWVCMSLTLAGVPLVGQQCVDPREFQQGSTGITLNVVVFKSTALPKSVSVALVP